MTMLNTCSACSGPLSALKAAPRALDGRVLRCEHCGGIHADLDTFEEVSLLVDFDMQADCPPEHLKFFDLTWGKSRAHGFFDLTTGKVVQFG